MMLRKCIFYQLIAKHSKKYQESVKSDKNFVFTLKTSATKIKFTNGCLNCLNIGHWSKTLAWSKYFHFNSSKTFQSMKLACNSLFTI